MYVEYCCCVAFGRSLRADGVTFGYYFKYEESVIVFSVAYGCCISNEESVVLVRVLVVEYDCLIAFGKSERAIGVTCGYYSKNEESVIVVSVTYGCGIWFGKS